MKSKRMPKEENAQKQLFTFLKGLMDCGLPFFAAAVPNGTYSNIRTAARNKATGLVSGVPDMFLCLNDGKTIWIEHKIKGNYLSKNQKAVHAKLNDLGHKVITMTAIDGSDLVSQWETLLHDEGII